VAERSLNASATEVGHKRCYVKRVASSPAIAVLSDAKGRHLALSGTFGLIYGTARFSRIEADNMEQEPRQPSKRWVINLCSLAAPLTIPQPRASRLTRFSFFLSHYREDGRRQYRLLMGYFSSAAEADKWLATLKRVYPQAFVSEAPDVQPDLMSNTQALRILEIGQIDRVGRVSRGADRVSEVNSRTPERVQEREAAGRGRTPVRKPYPSGGMLEDTLEELRTSEFNMGGDDDPNSTGVRHLRIEVQKDPIASPPRRRIGSHTRK
jgi:SPOR domain